MKKRKNENDNEKERQKNILTIENEELIWVNETKRTSETTEGKYTDDAE